MKTENYARLSFQERVIIETLFNEGKKRTFIAKKLNRNRSTVSREINRWLGGVNDVYKAKFAHWYSQDFRTRRSKDKISLCSQLRRYVYRGLLKHWSPEQIAGRIKIDFPNNAIMAISYEAIYLHIYKHRQATINKKLIALLPFHRLVRKKRGGPKKTFQIKDRTSIDVRPIYIEQRKQVGHWEGDLIVGIKQASVIGTVVERKTRYTYIVKLNNKKSDTVTKGFAKKLNKLNPKLRRTMTYDNGIEMARHKTLSQKTGMKIYFAHPYSSWERGTNENTNGLIRRFLPKGTDFNQIPASKLYAIQNNLNNRPRKILNYITPSEALKKEIKMMYL